MGAHSGLPSQKKGWNTRSRLPCLCHPFRVRALFGPVSGGVATRHAPATRFVPFRNGGVPGICAPDSLNAPKTALMFPEGTQPLASRWRAARHHRIASQNHARSRQGSKRLQRSIQRVRKDGRKFRSAVPKKKGWNTRSPIPRLCHCSPGPASSFQRGDSRLSTRSPGFRTM
jgi:hypothetical protein